MNQKWKYLLFGLIIILNIILKAWYAGFAAYSYDEIISVKDTLLDFGHIKHEAEWDNNPPFYYYVLWIWHQIVPLNEFNSRLLSVIFVSFAIGLSFLFAQKYFDNKTAIASAVLLTTSNFLTYYSQETRTYSLVLLLVLSSSFLFFRYLNKPILLNLFILSLVNFLIIYSHYIAGIVLIAQYLIVLVFHKKLIKVYFSVQTLLIIALIFLRFTKKQFLNIINYNHKDDFWLTTATFSDFLRTISELFYSPFTAIIFIFILSVFLYNYFKEKDGYAKDVKAYCFLLGFAAILFLFVIGTIKAIFLSRYLIFCIPFATIVVAYQLNKFGKSGLLIFILLVGIQFYGLKIVKDSGMDYRSIAEIIKLYKDENDFVIINTRDNIGLFEYYYDRESFMKYKAIDSICQTNNIYGLNDVEALKNLKFRENSKIFLIQSFHKIKHNDNPFDVYLSKQMSNLYSTNYYKGIEFHIYKNN